MKPTPREIAVLEGIAITGSAQGAADRLQISYHTVRTHIQNIHRRTGYSTAQAIAAGLLEGWLVLRDPIEGGRLRNFAE